MESAATSAITEERLTKRSSVGGCDASYTTFGSSCVLTATPKGEWDTSVAGGLGGDDSTGE